MALDNASNNDVMVKALGRLNNSFLGAVSHVRCFTHIINLVAKTVLHQFDTTCKGDDADVDTDADEAAALLSEIAASVDLKSVEDDNEGGKNDDDIDGWIDKCKDLSDEEHEKLRKSVLSVKLISAKVRVCTHCKDYILTLFSSSASSRSPLSTP